MTMPTIRRGLAADPVLALGGGEIDAGEDADAWDPTMRFSVSATTRAPRPGEVDGREYYFRSRAEFEAMVAAGEMLEHAEVFGNFYGSRAARSRSRWPRGATRSLTSTGRAASRSATRRWARCGVGLHPAALDCRTGAAAARPGQDSDEVIAGRMAKSQAEISHWAEYDYVLVNDDLDKTFPAADHLTAERMRRDRQPGLSRFRARPEQGVRGPMIYRWTASPRRSTPMPGWRRMRR
jgi:guanylate kinase